MIVVEIPPGLADAHRVGSVTGYRFPVATGTEIPAGEVTDQLIHNELPLIHGVVELYDVPPDTLEYFQQPILRRTSTDEDGTFTFDWLPVPGGPWMTFT